MEDHVRVYGPGTCCILNKNTRHAEAYSSDFEVCFLMLSDGFLQDVMAHDLQFPDFGTGRETQTPVYQELRSFLDEESVFSKVYLEFAPRTTNQDICDAAEYLFTQILMETRHCGPGFLCLVSGYLGRLFGLLSDSQQYELRRVDMKGTREDYLFNSVQRYLHANHGRVNYGELERMMHYTGDYLNRIVRRKCGMSLVDLGRSIALEEAAAMLRDTDRSVSEIMQILGYSNRTYFYRIFRQKYDVSPSQFRSQSGR